jgi:hypothetical protein
MKIKILSIVILILLFACKKDKESTPTINNNYFTYQGKQYSTPKAYYGVENDGIELTISSFIYNPGSGEYSGSGNGVDFIKLKSNGSSNLPLGTFQSFINWGDTTSSFIGEILIDVDTLYSGNYPELKMKSGSVTIAASSQGYSIRYDLVNEEGKNIKGQYDGAVLRN